MPTASWSPTTSLLGTRLDRYPWGKFPFPPDAPWLEPLTMLTAVGRGHRADHAHDRHPHRATAPGGAARQDRRHPRRPLRRTASSSASAPAGRRRSSRRRASTSRAAARCSPTPSRACRALWTDGPASFQSPTVSFDDVWSEPKPVRPGGPPVLFSGTLTPRNMRRIVGSATAGSRSWARPSTARAPASNGCATRYTAAGRDPGELACARHATDREGRRRPPEPGGDARGCRRARRDGRDRRAASRCRPRARGREGRRFFDDLASRWGRQMSVDVDLGGHVAVVTGGAGGIGGESPTCSRLRGARRDRRRRRGRARASVWTRSAAAGGTAADPVLADVRDPAAVARWPKPRSRSAGTSTCS